MKIDLKGLQLEIDKLDKTINSYEKNILNLYNQLSSVSIYWKDKNALRFIENVNVVKKQANVKLIELKSVKESLKYLIYKYESIGQQIEFDLKKKTIINKIFDDYILKLEKINKKYNQIDLVYFNSLSDAFIKQQITIQSIENDIKNIKFNINRTFDKLEEIELQFAQRLKKIKVDYIREMDLNVIISGE